MKKGVENREVVCVSNVRRICETQSYKICVRCLIVSVDLCAANLIGSEYIRRTVPQTMFGYIPKHYKFILEAVHAIAR